MKHLQNIYSVFVLSFFLAATLTFSSCKKDDDNKNITTPASSTANFTVKESEVKLEEYSTATILTARTYLKNETTAAFNITWKVVKEFPTESKWSFQIKDPKGQKAKDVSQGEFELGIAKIENNKTVFQAYIIKQDNTKDLKAGTGKLSIELENTTTKAKRTIVFSVNVTEDPINIPNPKLTGGIFALVGSNDVAVSIDDSEEGSGPYDGYKHLKNNTDRNIRLKWSYTDNLPSNLVLSVCDPVSCVPITDDHESPLFLLDTKNTEDAQHLMKAQLSFKDKDSDSTFPAEGVSIILRLEDPDSDFSQTITYLYTVSSKI